MSAEPRLFTRIEPAPQSGEATVIVGWRDSDGAESAVLRLPLKSALRALFDELDMALVLSPTGLIALDAKALPEEQFAALMLDNWPKASLSTLVRAMLQEIALVPDSSDLGDLKRLAQNLESAAHDVRAALDGMEAGKTSR